MGVNLGLSFQGRRVHSFQSSGHVGKCEIQSVWFFWGKLETESL